MTGFVNVFVEEHADIPDGCSMRFKTIGPVQPVIRLRYEADEYPGVEWWSVHSPHEDGSAQPASATLVEDSGAGVSTLIFGGPRGLRLQPADDPAAAPLPVPYLLLDPRALDR